MHLAQSLILEWLYQDKSIVNIVILYVLSAHQTVSQEKQSLSTQRENEVRKMKAENARMAEEVRTTQARFQSLEQKCERANDRVNELLAKQIEEQ